MAKLTTSVVSTLKNVAQEKSAIVNKENVSKMANAISNKAADIKESTLAVKEDIENKLTELDCMLRESVTEYNDAYTLMNDKGIKLYVERCRSTDTVGNVESLVNSIANHPKSFDADFVEIRTNRAIFVESCEFADRELQAARAAASGAGAGLAAGASVAFMAPTAAMWIATTFGTASTGTAISTLSGAAATKAALAWIGGGAISAGGGGMAAGSAFLALAGPIGWSIAGATLLSSILLFASKRTKLNQQKNEEIESVKRNIETVRELDDKIHQLLTQTQKLREGLNSLYTECMSCFGRDYHELDDAQKSRLGSLVNSTKALSASLEQTIE